MFFLVTVEVAVVGALDIPDTFPSDRTAAGRVGSTWTPSASRNHPDGLNPFDAVLWTVSTPLIPSPATLKPARGKENP